MSRFILFVAFLCFAFSMLAQTELSTPKPAPNEEMNGLGIAGLIALQYKAIEEFQQSKTTFQKAQEQEPENKVAQLALAAIDPALRDELACEE